MRGPGKHSIAPKAKDGAQGLSPEPTVEKLRSRLLSEFQSDAVELEERVPPKVARLALYGVTALIASTVLWAALSSVEEIVVTTGKLVTTQPTIVVQPLETSIMRAIDVETGDVVHAGDPLATFDATFCQSDVDQQRTKFAALRCPGEADRGGARRAGLRGRAERHAARGAPAAAAAPAAGLLPCAGSELRPADRGQAAAIDGNRKQQAILEKRLATLSEVENARQRLYDRETGSLLNLLSSRDARLDVDASLAQVKGDIIEADHTIAKLTADRQAFIEDFRRAAMEQLVELRSQRDAAAEELKKMELRRNMVALKAPADAVVLDLAQRSIGSVVREAEPILTLVPLNVPIEAEVSVNARDIGRLAVNEPARLKFDAYPFQKFGTATGKIRTISRDAFAPDQKSEASSSSPGLPYFKARVTLSDTRLRSSKEPARLLPGMAVTAEIKVGQRSILSYFLYPLIRGLDESIREPD